ncbi:sulfatase-like hydrolase/transferase [Rhodanobacter sp. PCA2]|uniref:sulfatase-like hydrolase/transferase n=1 Tax=Rhodanobacter sp. PCA2 TaxID=2006117 RepID=UPI0015E667EE|nr:sulfatase-like hydrolase/transferase [Rhodanobacter sp. PCA2]MBA2080006.1 sulfatase [Rhodanobacter sp. PCA2]
MVWFSVRFMRSGVVRAVAVLAFAACAWATVWPEPEPLQKLFVLALMLCVTGVLLCASLRPAFSLLLAGGLFFGLRFISDLKEAYLETALMPADFVYYARSSLLATLRHYPHLYLLGAGVLLLVPLLLVLAWKLDRPLLARRPGRGRTAWRIGGALLCAVAFRACLLPAGPFAALHDRNVWDKLSDDAQLTNFFVNLNDDGVTMPAMSDDATALRQWGATAQAPSATRPPPYPDIVQVLEESTFDPAIFAACDGVPGCRFAMFQPDARTRGTGMLRTHTFGGGTWVSEFAVHTGLPQDIFGPGGMYAPFVLAPHVHDTLPNLLRRLGYLTIAIYPTNGAFLNGRDAYRAYGFDHLYGAGELGLDEWEETDAQMFAAARRAYDKLKKPGQPVFVMILTINQHGPHDDNPMEKLPAPWRGMVQGLSGKGESALDFDTYLWRLHDSDVAMQGLERDFLDRDQPTVLVHFGDHQPSFEGLIRPLERRLPPELRPQRDFLTYYMIKSNFAGPPLPTYPSLDIAFLPTMVLQAAGLPPDPYFSAATALRERCQGRFDDCPDKPLLASYYAWVFGRLHVYE